MQHPSWSNWTTLYTHNGDTRLSSEYGMYTWVLQSRESSSNRFRYFRVLQTGKNGFVQSFGTPDTWSDVFVVGGFEIYGKIHNVQKQPPPLPPKQPQSSVLPPQSQYSYSQPSYSQSSYSTPPSYSPQSQPQYSAPPPSFPPQNQSQYSAPQSPDDKLNSFFTKYAKSSSSNSFPSQSDGNSSQSQPQNMSNSAKYSTIPSFGSTPSYTPPTPPVQEKAPSKSRHDMLTC